MLYQYYFNNFQLLKTLDAKHRNMTVSGALTLPYICVLKHVVASESSRVGAISLIPLIKKPRAFKYLKNTIRQQLTYFCQHLHSLKYLRKPHSAILYILQSYLIICTTLKVTDGPSSMEWGEKSYGLRTRDYCW
jgi:hypothetical protein